jgi:hypothetical protein
MAKALAFQILGTPDPGCPGNHLMVLQLGARYAKPQDDTTSLGVFHRTTDGRVGVLLERDDFADLAAWLPRPAPGPGRTDADFLPDLPERRNEDGSPQYYRARRSTAVQWELHDFQTTALITKYNGATDALLAVSVRWNGSGSHRGITLDRSGYDLLSTWMTRTDFEGWAGWKSGVNR